MVEHFVDPFCVPELRRTKSLRVGLQGSGVQVRVLGVLHNYCCFVSQHWNHGIPRIPCGNPIASVMIGEGGSRRKVEGNDQYHEVRSTQTV